MPTLERRQQIKYGKQMKSAREAAGLTLQEVANITGWKERELLDIEDGLSWVTPKGYENYLRCCNGIRDAVQRQVQETACSPVRETACSPVRVMVGGKSDFYAEPWEADEMVIMGYGGPIGCTVSRSDARAIVRWITSALPELVRRITEADHE